MKRTILLILLTFVLLLGACGQRAPAYDEASGVDDNNIDIPPAAPNHLTGIFGAGEGFPAMHIDTGGQAIDSREVWVDITVSIRNTADDFQFENAIAQARGRGNSSWTLPKRPFRIRFDEPRALLCADHAAHNWTLIANHSDKALMRNYSAYFLAGLLDGMYRAPYARFVDLYVNGLYAGVYMLCIQMEVGPGRVDVIAHRDPAISEYFIQMDMRAHYDGVLGETFVEISGMRYAFRYPPRSEFTPGHVAYVLDFLTRVDSLILAQDEAVFDYIHLPSFIDFYLVQELFKNQDVAFSSVFMQIRGQGANRRLEMGPVWDFDIAAGNAYYQGQYYEEQKGYSPQGVWVTSMHPWYRELIQMPVFRDAAAARWREIRDTQVAQTIQRIDFLATVYYQQFLRNFVRWPILDTWIWPNPPTVAAIHTFRGQVDYLINFLEERSVWMDGFLSDGYEDEKALDNYEWTQ